MGWSWVKVSVFATALAALEGCCPGQDDRLNCDLQPTSGVTVTVKGTAEYMIAVAGDAVVDSLTYFNGEDTKTIQYPKQPFSVTVELEVGDSFGSTSYGYMTDGSITAHDIFTPADGSAITDSEQRCWTREPG
jgi:hypothetical protein